MRWRKLFTLFYGLLLPSLLRCQDINFDIQKIPEAVRKNAAQVVRFENIELNVSDFDHAKLNVHKIVTVLNEGGKDALLFAEFTDKYISLEDAEFRLYDASGKQISKYKYRDLNTMGLGEGLIDDSKTYYLRIPASSFPVTVESRYEIHYKGLIFFPHYYITEPEKGVEHSSYTAKVAKEIGLRYKEKNIHLKPTITEDPKFQIYTWEVNNLSPMADEKFTVSNESRFPSILLAPNNFKLDEYPGNMETWESFGKWYSLLQQGMGVLSPERVEFYKNLVEGAKDNREKIRIAYDYLQSNFRYVNISLGIGGFKPFPATVTDSKKYGDCKALSNYMQAVLSCLGIKSYQALINAEYNKEPVDPAFPCQQFNHVILCVPMAKDSLWLECTSRTSDFGVLGNFTENRNALLITENGGVLVPTPKSKASENRFYAHSQINLRPEGSAITTTLFSTTGEYKEELIGLANEKLDEQKNYAMQRWGFKEPDSIGFSRTNSQKEYQLLVKQEPENITEFRTGSKIFLAPRIYLLFPQKLPPSENRHEDFYFDIPFEKSDTSVFNLPDGYTLDALPDSRVLQCKYANYTCKYWFDEKNNAVYSTAGIQLNQYKIPAADYPEVKKFFDDVTSDDLQRIILKKKN